MIKTFLFFLNRATTPAALWFIVPLRWGSVLAVRASNFFQARDEGYEGELINGQAKRLIREETSDRLPN